MVPSRHSDVSYYMVLAHEQAVAAAASAAHPAAAVKRKRARHPAGAVEQKPGTFVADDPATEQDEAWVEE